MSRTVQNTLWRATSWLLVLLFAFSPLGGAAGYAALPPQENAPPAAPQAAGDHLVTGISLTPSSPNILSDGQQVSITFQYVTTESSGVRIFIRPFTNGSLTPGYGAHASPVYPAGSGQGSGYFTIYTGEVVVDQIRIQMWDAAQTTLLFEAFLPVYYLFTNAAHAVTNITLAPDTPNVLNFSANVSLGFQYVTTEQSGVRIWARPFTNGSLTPGYGAHASSVYPVGSGQGGGYFTISSGQVVVDQIRIQMWDAAQTTLLFEAFLPVYYRFMDAANSVTNISFTPATPNIFAYGDTATLQFNYQVNSSNGARIFVRPFSGVNLSPGYAAHGSGVYTGSGQGSGYFSLGSGPAVVDRVRIQMVDASLGTLLYEAFLPAHLLWAGAGPPPGPDMSVDAIEVTQAIQDLNNSVVLVAGKRTYVRVHVSSPTTQSNVYATLRGRRGTIPLTPVLSPGNPGGDITVRSSPDRGQRNDSFWFELPASWTSAGSLTLTARLDPNNATFDPDTSDNSMSVTVNFQSTPPMRLRLVNVRYTSGGATYLTSDAHLDALESWLRRAYPIGALEVTRSVYEYPYAGLPDVDTLHSLLAVSKIMNILFRSEDLDVVYYGVVDDGGGFMRGRTAGIPSTISAGPSGSGSYGWDFDGSYTDWYGGHELGHSRGRYHAEFCGAGSGAAYPYSGGRISPAISGSTAIYGFDIETRAIYPPTWKDVMTYCPNQWISDFTYEGIRDYIVSVGLNAVRPQRVSASEFLMVTGMADLADNTARLTSVYKLAQQASLPLPESGSWSIDLLDSSGNTIASYPFAPRELSDTEGSSRPAVIAELVPWTSGAVKVAIRYQDTILDERAASANPPGVSIAPADSGLNAAAGTFTLSWTGSDSDGDSLAYTMLYSRDGGSTWQTLVTGLDTSSLTLDTDQLPGGTLLFRVIATDGFLTGESISGAYTIPLHAPTVQILGPADKAVFYPSQMVILQGSAYDLEDGMPADSAYQWVSSLDGALGSGAALNTAELTTGDHTITLTVTDTDGMSAQTSINLTIAAPGTTEALNLDAAPLGVGAVLDFAGPGATYTLTLRSSGESEIAWTASEDIPWLSLDAASGTTPSDIVLTIDPAGLPVGQHNGVITLTSSGAANSPVDIPVSLQITGNTLYLPLLTR